LSKFLLSFFFFDQMTLNKAFVANKNQAVACNLPIVEFLCVNHTEGCGGEGRQWEGNGFIPGELGFGTLLKGKAYTDFHVGRLANQRAAPIVARYLPRTKSITKICQKQAENF
jgi:hypothetical protein